jgi:hypothetical protein
MICQIQNELVDNIFNIQVNHDIIYNSHTFFDCNPLCISVFKDEIFTSRTSFTFMTLSYSCLSPFSTLFFVNIIINDWAMYLKELN